MIKSREYTVNAYQIEEWGLVGLNRKRRIVIIENTTYDDGYSSRHCATVNKLTDAIAICESLNRDRGIKPQEAHA